MDANKELFEMLDQIKAMAEKQSQESKKIIKAHEKFERKFFKKFFQKLLTN